MGKTAEKAQKNLRNHIYRERVTFGFAHLGVERVCDVHFVLAKEDVRHVEIPHGGLQGFEAECRTSEVNLKLRLIT